jgi:serine/threonine protein kinase/Tol biopolymer transport system component
MPLPIGSRLGPYEILAPLGAGGMGEVYRAADTRLKRQVAIKILPGDLAADHVRLARFQREAELLASINHPHIAAIYGLEDAGVRALVMELVDGPTLAERIERGPIPVDEALPIARQIAEALEAAHEQGIVHRDLKPANIKVRDDGTVKVLDFGLAKPRERAGGASDIGVTIGGVSAQTMELPPAFDSGSGRQGTAAGPVSQAGVILGTAAYMSPEQARGRTVDKRTDVWAFGAVLYEMLAGVRAFEGSDVTEVIASVMKATPDWSALPPDTPPQVVTLITRCLEKDKAARIGDMAVARFLLSRDATIAESVAVAAPSVVKSSPRARAMLPWIAAALAVGAVFGWLLPRRPAANDAITHLQMDVAPAEQLTPSENTRYRPSRTAVAIAPDGSAVVFAGIRRGVAQLYLRPLDRADAAIVPGTEGGYAPFYSPDGAWIAFAADNKLKKVPAAGGPAAVVCDLPPGQFWGASWADTGTIYFAGRAGIFGVPAAGGSPAPITTLDVTKLDRHLLPRALPGGRFMLYTAPPNIVVRPLDGGAEHTLVEGTDARYVATGHLVYMKNGTLMAAPFDARTARLTGAAVALLDGVMQSVNAGNSNEEALAGQFDVSASGTLVYAGGGVFPPRLLTLVMVDRRGAAEPIAGSTPRLYLFPRLSHDGAKVAVETRDSPNGATDIWVYDVARGTPTRLTVDGGSRPVWSPDNSRILYSHFADGVSNLFVVNADGSGRPERLLTATVGQSPASWAPGTNTIAFLQRPTPDTFGIWTLPMSGADGRKPALWLESRFVLTHAEFSPDGRWIAYVSNESGGPEVYVQAVGGGGKTRVSTAGGFEPLWTANGREILFRSVTIDRNPTFVSAAVRSTTPLHIDPPRVMFEAKPTDYDSTTPVRAWDATPDGQHFVLSRVGASTEQPVTALNVVLNWTSELRRRVRIKN